MQKKNALDSLESIFYLKRQEKKLAVKALLEKDPEKRQAIKREAQKISEKRKRISELSGKREKATKEA